MERQLSQTIMRGSRKPKIRTLVTDDTLVEQGDAGEEVFLILDGIIAVEVDGKSLAELGPGAILGERAWLEGGKRTSTLRALTTARIAVAAPDQMSPEALAELASGHHREETL